MSKRKQAKLAEIIESFIPRALERGDLRRANVAKNKCRSVSGEFAGYAASRGLEPEAIVQLDIRYLDSGEVAFRHWAVIFDIGKAQIIVDWTANQFFEADVPAIFDDLDAWVGRIDGALGGRYEYPVAELLELTCR